MEASIFSDYFLPVTLSIIMWGMGLSLEVRDIKNIFLYPRAITIGLISQMMVLPVIAFAIAFIADLDPVYKVGLVLISACPGGATSNLVTYLLRGNVALCVSMTALNSLLILITIPLITNLALWTFMHQSAEIHLSLIDTIMNIIIVIIIPVIIGMYIRSKFPKFSDNARRPLKYLLPVILALVYAGVIFTDGEKASTAEISDFLFLFPYALLLNLLATFAGYYIPKINNMNKRKQFTIAVEVGLQNSALAIFVASSLLERNDIAIVAVVYGSFSFFTTAFYGYLIKKFA